MEGWNLLLELIAALAAAFLIGALFERFRIGAVVGYIVAGALVGPTATGVVQDMGTVRGLAELGIAIVLFTTGLEFSLLRLKKLGRSTLFAGIAQLIVCLIVFSAIALIAGFSLSGAISVGAICSVSSTAIVLRTLRERGDLDASHGKTAFGILLIQDIALVPLVLLVTLLGSERSAFSVASIVPAVGGFLAAAIVFMIVVTRFLPKAFRSRAMATNRELPVLLAIVTCTGSAWAAHAVGVSPSLGAFLAGVLLAETSFEEQIRSDMAALKALFGTLFFASVGMLIDIGWLMQNWAYVLVATVVVVFVKIIANFAAIRMFKRTTIASAASAIALAQVGELGFILIQIASETVISKAQSQALTSVAVLSIIVSPFLVARSPRFARSLAKRLIPVRKLAIEETTERKEALKGHFVVVGFGTAGRTVTRILSEARYQVVAVDVDPKFARVAQELGAISKVGDATQVDLLDELHLNDAKALIIALPDHRSAALVISHSRRLAPDLMIVARARYHQFQDELREAGATHIIGEEELLGRRLGEDAVRLAVGIDDDEVREAP